MLTVSSNSAVAVLVPDFAKIKRCICDPCVIKNIKPAPPSCLFLLHQTNLGQWQRFRNAGVCPCIQFIQIRYDNNMNGQCKQ